jgi:hypothetical protein
MLDEPPGMPHGRIMTVREVVAKHSWIFGVWGGFILTTIIYWWLFGAVILGSAHPVDSCRVIVQHPLSPRHMPPRHSVPPTIL